MVAEDELYVLKELKNSDAPPTYHIPFSRVQVVEMLDDPASFLADEVAVASRHLRLRYDHLQGAPEPPGGE